MDDGNRITVQVQVDKVLVERAEAAGLDLSHVAERALRNEIRETARAAMSDADKEELLRQIAEEIASRNKMIEEDGLFGQEWRTW